MGTYRLQEALSKEAFAVYAEAVRRVEPTMDDETLRHGLNTFRVRKAEGGELIMKMGQQADHTVLVLSGLLRGYFLHDDGQEHTVSFVPEGHFACSLAALLSPTPAPVHLIAEERTVLLVTPCDEYLEFLREAPTWGVFARKFAQSWMSAKAQREYELLALDAAARRASLAERLPGLEGRVAARHIASYLGITPVHLSRLRRRQIKRVAG